MQKVAPLSGSFMIASIIGFLISAIYVYPRSSKFGFAFAIIFVIMFVASMISITYAPISEKTKIR